MDGGGFAQLEESQLLQQARDFDKATLAWIYETYHDAIYRYIYRHLGHAQTAQDLTSDAFRRLLQALRKGSGPTRQLSAWLYRVAHNLIVDELRRRQHRDHAPLDGELGETLKGETKNLDRVADNALALEHVRDALLTLTDQQRQVVVLKFLEGLSNAEVAEIMGKTVGAVKALQHRGIQALRDQLVTAPDSLPAGLREQIAVPAFGN